MDIRPLLLVAAGGAIGAILRHQITLSLPMESHWATMGINLLGALLLGILAGGLHNGGIISDDMLLFLGTGLLGAFTTMSTFSLDLATLFDAERFGTIGIHLVATGVLGPTLAFVGWRLTSIAL
tara:strand:+ start:311 stop:682 length:372 start_codon:yes stop_codon:yes gene_type:complete